VGNAGGNKPARRIVEVQLGGSITPRGSLRGRHRRPGSRGFVVDFVERTKLSKLGRVARESLRFDRSSPHETMKTHRVEELGDGGEWVVVHEETAEFPAKRRSAPLSY
jgi:hypothetical protein